MKKKLMIIQVLLVIVIKLNSQDPVPYSSVWPSKSNSLSLYASTILGAFTPINISYDHMVHKPKLHLGYTTGITTTLYEGVEYGTLGFHMAMTVITGMENNHFEAKLGGVINPIKLWSDGYDDFAFFFVPVISVGYRFQKPGDNKFYRIALSTGGIGFGIGGILK